jgi:hypothetical protein
MTSEELRMANARLSEPVAGGEESTAPPPQTGALTPRAAFLAANPDRAQLTRGHLASALGHVDEFSGDIKTGAEQFVTGSEHARQAGIYFKEYTEMLPGKKLTLDLYEQDKHLFITPKGLRVSHEQVLWHMRVAGRQEPFTLISDVAGFYKEALLGAGVIDKEAREQQTAHVPPEPPEKIKEYFSISIADTINALRQNPKYCPDGHLRPDLRATMAVDLKPKLTVWDSAREWVRQEIGL